MGLISCKAKTEDRVHFSIVLTPDGEHEGSELSFCENCDEKQKNKEDFQTAVVCPSEIGSEIRSSQNVTVDLLHRRDRCVRWRLGSFRTVFLRYASGQQCRICSRASLGSQPHQHAA